MVACRITDARNTASCTGSASSSQVPLKKFKQTRISSIIHVFVAILHWIWPPDRCDNCHSIYSMPKDGNTDRESQNVGEIHRSEDGRFVLTSCGGTDTTDQDVVDGLTTTEQIDDGVDDRRQSTSGGSQYSSSDDGGFLPRPRIGINKRSSWRRPLVASPSQLSLRSDNSARSFLQSLGEFFLQTAKRNKQQNNIANYQNIYKNYPLQQTPPTMDITNQQPNLFSTNINQQNINFIPQTPINSSSSKMFQTPSRISRIFSSSPASTIGVPTTPFQQTFNQFSDLSSVYPGSAERSSFPHHSSSFSALLNNRFKYSYELPSLRTIQEETRRMNQGFIPLHIPSPSWRGYYHTQTPYHSYRPRTRWYPRHFSRAMRINSDLLSPLPHLNLSMRGTTHFGGNSGLEISPESRSSSSGFGSKHTSSNNPLTQTHGSHHSSSTNEWRLLPPYRPPPPPHYHPYYPNFNAFNYSFPHQQHQQPLSSSFTLPSSSHQTSSSFLQSQHQQQQQQQQPTQFQLHEDSPSPPFTMQHWLDMISRLNSSNEINTLHHHKSVDVGSVDGHYEFDPSTPTPSASTPTGNPRDEFLDPSLFGAFSSTNPWSTSFSSGFNTLSGPSTMLQSSGANSSGVSRKQRVSRYDNIEARVQAMKEEFYAYRKRQAMRRAGVELESAC